MPPLWPSVHEWTTLVFEAALANEIISFRYFCGCPRKIYLSYLCNHLALRNKEGKLTPSGQNHADSAGNPWGWWTLGGGESPEKFGL